MKFTRIPQKQRSNFSELKVNFVIMKIIVFYIVLFSPHFFFSACKIHFYGLELKFKELQNHEEYAFVNPVKNDQKYHLLEQKVKNDISDLLLTEINTYRRSYRIEELALLQVLKKMSESYSQNKNIQKMFLRELLIYLGYEAVLYIKGNELSLYSKFDTHFSNILFLNSADGNYYCDVYFNANDFGENKTRINEKNESLKFFQASQFHFKIPEENVRLFRTFSFNGREYSISYLINRNLVKYLSSLPEFEINQNYTDSLVSVSVLIPFFETLKTSQLKDTTDILNFMLKYCQSIKYIDDMKSFKIETKMFPVQMIYNDFGDCDDKTILFSFFAKYFLKGRAIYYFLYENEKHMNLGLDYKSKKIKGYTIDVNGKDILVCEPTGENLEIGRQADKFKDLTPIIYLLRQ